MCEHMQIESSELVLQAWVILKLIVNSGSKAGDHKMCTTYKRNVASGICSIFVHWQPIIDPMVLPRCMPPEAEAEADSSPIDGSLSFNFRPYRSDLHLLASYRCVAARPASIPIRSCTCRCTYIYYYVTCHSDVRIIFFSIYQLDRTAFFFKFDLDNLKIKF